MKRKFTPNARIALFALLALPLLLALGIWQLQRGFEKRDMEQQYRQQQSAPPVEFRDHEAADLPAYRRLIVRGRFDNRRHWLLDNKQRRGRVGYEVITPFQLEQGQWLLVNRGWLPAGASRSELPAIPEISGQTTLFAQVAPGGAHPMLSARHQGDQWPRVVTALEVEEMAEQLNRPLLPVTLRLDQASPGALTTGWPSARMGAHRHWGYAFQWFALALTLLIWLGYATRRNP